MDFTTIDKKGDWFVNPHAYPFTDPTPNSKGEQTKFATNHAVRVTKTPWIDAQIAAGVLLPWTGPDDEGSEDPDALLEAKEKARAFAAGEQAKIDIKARDAELAARERAHEKSEELAGRGGQKVTAAVKEDKEDGKTPGSTAATTSTTAHKDDKAAKTGR